MQRRWKCKRQLEGAEGEGGVGGWVGDEEEEKAERTQHQRQHQRRNQVQQQEAALGGAAGEPAGGEVPQEEHRRTGWQGEEVHMKEGVPYGWRRAYSLPPSLSHHSGLNSPAGLTVWRHKERQRGQLGAAGVPAPETMQPGGKYILFKPEPLDRMSKTID